MNQRMREKQCDQKNHCENLKSYVVLTGAVVMTLVTVMREVKEKTMEVVEATVEVMVQLNSVDLVVDFVCLLWTLTSMMESLHCYQVGKEYSPYYSVYCSRVWVKVVECCC